MIVEKLKNKFNNKAFTSDQFYNFYLEEEPDLKKTTFRWRVHSLKNEGVIYSPRRGLYLIGSKNIFNPVIDKKLYNLYKRIKKEFPYSDICIWETTWLNKYMVHQAITSNIIVEIDKEAASSTLAFLQESFKNVYLNPGKREMENYIQSGRGNIIIKNLPMDSPVDNLETITIPRIEKIIVDLFVDIELYNTYQGRELRNIYEEFFSNFNINQSTIKRYATRRSVGDRLITYLKEDTSIGNENIYI